MAAPRSWRWRSAPGCCSPSRVGAWERGKRERDLLLRRGHRIALVTDSRGGGFGDRLPEVTVEHVSAGGLVGTSLVHRARSLASLAMGLIQARRIVARLDPEL